MKHRWSVVLDGTGNTRGCRFCGRVRSRYTSPSTGYQYLWPQEDGRWWVNDVPPCYRLATTNKERE